MKKLLSVSLVLLLASACNFSGQMKDIISLSSEINEKYNGSASVTLNNNTVIEVKLDNSPYCDSSNDVKQRISEDIGRMVMKHRSLGKTLKEGTTVFSCHTSYAIVDVSRENSFSMKLHKD
jgi:hypothetical protein